MGRLQHGYTNRTALATAETVRTVVKTYEGPNAAGRSERERTMLRRLRGRVPVPPLLGAEHGVVVTGFVAGAHGQDLLDAGHAVEVLTACGELLARLHRVDVRSVLPKERGRVLVHGDFGPNNVLFAPGPSTVAALLDWEWAHAGDPVTDLAWCEWVVRMHHPAAVPALRAFYAAYGSTPDWTLRRAAMLARCLQLRDFCRSWHSGGPGEQEWARRLRITRTWPDLF